MGHNHPAKPPQVRRREPQPPRRRQPQARTTTARWRCVCRANVGVPTKLIVVAGLVWWNICCARLVTPTRRPSSEETVHVLVSGKGGARADSRGTTGHEVRYTRTGCHAVLETMTTRRCTKSPTVGLGSCTAASHPTRPTTKPLGRPPNRRRTEATATSPTYPTEHCAPRSDRRTVRGPAGGSTCCKPEAEALSEDRATGPVSMAIDAVFRVQGSRVKAAT